MTPISYARHRFPPDVLRHAVWLYLRFTLSYRDVEDLLVERGLDVSHEAIRRWVLKFGLEFARNVCLSVEGGSRGQLHPAVAIVGNASVFAPAFEWGLARSRH